MGGSFKISPELLGERLFGYLTSPRYSCKCLSLPRLLGLGPVVGDMVYVLGSIADLISD